MPTPLPPRFCEICGCIHEPPIHDLSRCYPGKNGGRIYFTKLPDWDYWPTKEEMQEQIAYWDAVFQDKGIKPLS